jgi:uncharacterized protein (DUF1330 family)
VTRRTQVLAALAIGIIIGVTGIEIVRAAGKPAAYMVVEYEITDRDAFQAYIKGTNAIPTSRIFLARHAKGVTLSGDPPQWIGILKYSSLDEALAFESSPEYQALIATRDKGAKWRAYVVEGLPE